MTEERRETAIAETVFEMLALKFMTQELIRETKIALMHCEDEPQDDEPQERQTQDDEPQERQTQDDEPQERQTQDDEPQERQHCSRLKKELKKARREYINEPVPSRMLLTRSSAMNISETAQSLVLKTQRAAVALSRLRGRMLNNRSIRSRVFIRLLVYRSQLYVLLQNRYALFQFLKINDRRVQYSRPIEKKDQKKLLEITHGLKEESPETVFFISEEGRALKKKQLSLENSVFLFLETINGRSFSDLQTILRHIFEKRKLEIQFIKNDPRDRRLLVGQGEVLHLYKRRDLLDLIQKAKTILTELTSFEESFKRLSKESYQEQLLHRIASELFLQTRRLFEMQSEFWNVRVFSGLELRELCRLEECRDRLLFELLDTEKSLLKRQSVSFMSRTMRKRRDSEPKREGDQIRNTKEKEREEDQIKNTNIQKKKKKKRQNTEENENYVLLFQEELLQKERTHFLVPNSSKNSFISRVGVPSNSLGKNHFIGKSNLEIEEGSINVYLWFLVILASVFLFLVRVVKN